MNDRPATLTGYRVMDLTEFEEGSTCARILAVMGADVIRIEPAAGRGGVGTHAGRSLAVDWRQDAGRALVRAIAARVDVVVENFPAGVLDRAGLGYQALRADNPGLIMCSIGNPVQRPTAGGDGATGVAAAMAIGFALLHRERTGQGQYIGTAEDDVPKALTAALPGQHNEVVLQELLGLTDVEITALYRNKVLVRDPSLSGRQPRAVRFLVFQHEASEHPGSFRDAWRDDGIVWDTIELDAGEKIPDDLERYDALVVMGGPMDVWQEGDHPWLVAEKQAIRKFVVDLRRPFLGICLGHQLLADALGGRVAPAQRPEVGIATVVLTEAGREDPLLRGFGNRFATLQWHGAEVTRVPDGAIVLAGNEACAIQAFRWGEHAYGVQFHPEITEESVAEFDQIAVYRDFLRAQVGDAGAVRLAAVARARMPAFIETARLAHRNFRRILTGEPMGELTGADPAS